MRAGDLVEQPSDSFSVSLRTSNWTEPVPSSVGERRQLGRRERGADGGLGRHRVGACRPGSGAVGRDERQSGGWRRCDVGGGALLGVGIGVSPGLRASSSGSA